ncbi:MAG: AHH domain-containing protein [Anaeromyxobacter sp.]
MWTGRRWRAHRLPPRRPGSSGRSRWARTSAPRSGPDWNNAHHLIPKATFADAIMDVEDPEIRDLVSVGLHRGQYNINHYKNMLFLPMDQEVAQVLRLPRHLTLNGPADVHVPSDYADHEHYTAEVVRGLDPVIRDFEQHASQARGTPPDPCKAMETIQITKEKLERLSEQCFQGVVAFGGTSPGASLNDIGSLDFQLA